MECVWEGGRECVEEGNKRRKGMRRGNSSNHLPALLWVSHSGQRPGQHFRCWSPQENLAYIAEVVKCTSTVM